MAGSAGEGEVQTLSAIFTDVERDALEALLAATGGDLQAAVDLVFASRTAEEQLSSDHTQRQLLGDEQFSRALQRQVQWEEDGAFDEQFRALASTSTHPTNDSSEYLQMFESNHISSNTAASALETAGVSSFSLARDALSNIWNWRRSSMTQRPGLLIGGDADAHTNAVHERALDEIEDDTLRDQVLNRLDSYPETQRVGLGGTGLRRRIVRRDS